MLQVAGFFLPAGRQGYKLIQLKITEKVTFWGNFGGE
jgi:hypothetical protein